MRNKKNIILLALFLFSLAAGLYYPVSRIMCFEFPKKPPVIARFDIRLAYLNYHLIGRYLHFRTPEHDIYTQKRLDINKPLYAVLELDENGVATTVDLAQTRPAGKVSLKLEPRCVRTITNEEALNSTGTLLYTVTNEEALNSTDKLLYTVYFPFNGFRMSEELNLPRFSVPNWYRNLEIRSGLNTVSVKIYENGLHNIVGVDILGVPAAEFIKKNIEENAAEMPIPPRIEDSTDISDEDYEEYYDYHDNDDDEDYEEDRGRVL